MAAYIAWHATHIDWLAIHIEWPKQGCRLQTMQVADHAERERRITGEPSFRTDRAKSGLGFKKNMVLVI